MKSSLATELLSYLYEHNGNLYWGVKPARKIVVGSLAGTINKYGYSTITFKGVKFLSHRLVYLLYYGYIPELIDHINGDKLDNRILNLRVCNKQENSCNAKISSMNTSGIKGVTWHKISNKWRVRLGQIHLGLFTSLCDAKAVAENYRNEKHGEFARHK